MVQGTFLIPPYSAPDPEFHVFDVLVGTPDDRLPLLFLVIEVSHRTYKRDSGRKLRLYASIGIKDYWILNLLENRLEVYRKPENPTGKADDWRYASAQHHKPGAKAKLLAYPKTALPVDEMLR